MKWTPLESVDQVDELIQQSHEAPILIFKHSTRCSISSAALDRMERRWQPEEMHHFGAYFLDLIRHRDVSNAVSEKLNVYHQSPQAIVVSKGEVVYEDSHFSISYDEIKTIKN
jgi:bacillithiol system protein YtxJ